MNHGVKHVAKQWTVAKVLPPLEQSSIQLARRVRPTVNQRGICGRNTGRRGSNAPRPQNGPFGMQSLLSGIVNNIVCFLFFGPNVLFF